MVRPAAPPWLGYSSRAPGVCCTRCVRSLCVCVCELHAMCPEWRVFPRPLQLAKGKAYDMSASD
eukprot:6850427-Prorocentrum_lima.AAC.1